MDSNQQSLSLASMGLDWVTTTHLVLIALCAVGATIILIWGRHLRRQRIEADEAVEENNESVEGNETPPREP